MEKKETQMDVMIQETRQYIMDNLTITSMSNEELEDKIEEPENRQESLLNKMLLEQLLGSLEAKERELIYMRFFQEKTQMQIAGELGISQVQVSRMEKKILKVLREQID